MIVLSAIFKLNTSEWAKLISYTNGSKCYYCKMSVLLVTTLFLLVGRKVRVYICSECLKGRMTELNFSTIKEKYINDLIDHVEIGIEP